MIKYDEVGNWYRVIEKTTMTTDIIPREIIMNQFSSMNRRGVITLLPGFCWDGATGAIDTSNIMEASAFHDFLCRAYKESFLTKEQRKQADKLFKTNLKETDMPRFRVKYIYQMVRKFFELKH